MYNRIVLLIGVSVTIGFVLLSTTLFNLVTAQYSGAGDVGSATLEEQLTQLKRKLLMLNNKVHMALVLQCLGLIWITQY